MFDIKALNREHRVQMYKCTSISAGLRVVKVQYTKMRKMDIEAAWFG